MIFKEYVYENGNPNTISKWPSACFLFPCYYGSEMNHYQNILFNIHYSYQCTILIMYVSLNNSKQITVNWYGSAPALYPIEIETLDGRDLGDILDTHF